jgi:anti-sigma factor RsiW
MSDDITTDLACKELVEIITDYLEGTLPEHDRARFDAHLMTCPPCREYVAEMHTTLRLTGRLTTDSISAGARDELLRAFRRMKASSTGL